MCTVTYIPSLKGVHITSNRDERHDRGAALEPEKYGDVNGRQLLYPKDIEGGGSWITLKDNGDAAVLLNGAIVPHTRNLSFITGYQVNMRGIFPVLSARPF
jgi:Transport and Golgi organisation 2